MGPQDPLKAAQVEMAMGAFGDMLSPLIDILFRTSDEAQKEEKKKNFLAETLPKYLGGVEKTASDEGHVVGTETTLADIFVYNFWTNALVKNFEEFKKED